MAKREYIKTDKNGTKYFNELVPCDRCGGDGVYKWGAMFHEGNGAIRPQFAGVCFKCLGNGKVWEEVKEYTPEYRAKLDAQNERRKAKQREKWEAERAEREAQWAKECEERRIAEEERRKAEAARKAISQYVGEIGNRMTFTVKLEKRVDYEVPSFRGFGTDCARMFILVDESGNKFVWKTTSGCLWEDPEDHRRGALPEGGTVTIKGTIKKHGEYNGEKQTELSRVTQTA